MILKSFIIIPQPVGVGLFAMEESAALATCTCTSRYVMMKEDRRVAGDPPQHDMVTLYPPHVPCCLVVATIGPQCDA